MGRDSLRHIGPAEQPGFDALTRISVTGSNGLYFVRRGNTAPVRVWAAKGVRDGLKCECGVPRCAHIASLLLCGFVENEEQGTQAA